MLFKQSLITLVASALLHTATAVPVEATPFEAEITKRGPNEGVYLSNCQGGATWSEIVYYSNAKSGSQHGEQPQAIDIINASGTIHWEGSQICGFFQDSGETFCVTIQSDAQTKATGAKVGTGHNNETPFNCFKDNNRNLYSGNGFSCQSIYYCFDVSIMVGGHRTGGGLAIGVVNAGV
ncbi:uncharacterized protein BP5553_05422 [Venustampulla echinocandica]|uniref:Uncharacterized protein n=1 Tax=Venustampulla echinocandica TaxID=2656787 RepID=A0A370TR48_9HELO|nr:uncharacterized protein BP5553_05422 [Venustampulla echinocandica]RDL37989.1 hypothetical protein BP5553_05422 [Venustampulla echinocandica]